MKRYLILILLMSLASIGLAQYKYEKESRIKKNQVPVKAVSFVDSMMLNTKMRWYRETGYNQTTFEAKAKYQGKRWSIEFSHNGTFEDLEIEIVPKEVPLVTYDAITRFLSDNHGKYKIKKVQIQYRGNPNHVQKFIHDPESAPEIITNYEIVISTKEEGSYVMFEYLFDESGKSLRKSRIILKMTDNIEF